VGAVAALTLLGATAASAAADTTPAPRTAAAPSSAPPAGVTVDVLGGGTPAHEHAAIDYTIELRDTAAVPYRHVSVTAMLPPGFHILRSSPAATASPGPTPIPTWTTDLLPGRPVDIQAELVAGTVQDLAQVGGSATGPGDVVEGSGTDLGDQGMAWYSLAACAQSGPAGVPVCGLSRQLLVKTGDDTRRGIEAIVLILGVPLAVGVLGVYAWRARREPPVQ
jgi:hypothetical protein